MIIRLVLVQQRELGLLPGESGLTTKVKGREQHAGPKVVGSIPILRGPPRASVSLPNINHLLQDRASSSWTTVPLLPPRTLSLIIERLTGPPKSQKSFDHPLITL